MPSPTPRPDYGLNAPGVVRNLFLVAAAGLAVWLAAALGLWSGAVGRVHVAGMGLGFFLSFSLTGLNIVWANAIVWASAVWYTVYAQTLPRRDPWHPPTP